MTKNPIEKPQVKEENANKNQDQVEGEAYNNKNQGTTREAK
jgi:hypothetical protein